MRDLQTNATDLREPGHRWDGRGDDSSLPPSISADGRFVAFTSKADSLSGDDNDAFDNIFVRDLESGVTTYASRTRRFGGRRRLRTAAISADGRFVAFRLQRPQPEPGGR